MISMPKISIIVPVYNVEKYISKCLDSIINQIYNNLEIIIVNDGTMDRSANICDYYAQKDNRIILIHQENQGLSMARNNALDIISGDYVGFVDSDDWIAPDMFSLLYKNMIAYDTDIAMCKFIYVTESGQEFYNEEHDGVTTTILEGFDKIADHLHDYSNIVVWNKLYKRCLFDNIRFPKGKLYEDIFVSYKLIDKANKVVKCSKSKYYYLLRNNSISRSRFTLNKMDKVEGFIERHGYISERYPELEILCRTTIFCSLIDRIYDAYREGYFEIHQEELIKTVRNVFSKYDISDCIIDSERKNKLVYLCNSHMTLASILKKAYE